MRTLYYISSHNSTESGRDMKCVPSSLTYNRYLISSFEQIPETKVIALSGTISRQKAYWNKKTIQNGNHAEVYFRSIPYDWGKTATWISFIWLYVQLFFYLFFRIKKNDVVIIYNGRSFSFLYKLFRYSLRCKFIYVVAEIFSAVWDLGEEAIKTECSHMLDADGYIFTNDIMPRLFSAEHKCAICYGIYEYSNSTKVRDDKIHVLYAGKISTGIINDAFLALEVIKYLPDNYVMHIAGYGNEADIKQLTKEVTAINAELGKTKVTFEGNLSGDKYEDLLSKCQIGLCTRTLRNELSNYCFPSKTMVYLTHDIIPVCPRIDNLLESRISNRLVFVDGELKPVNISKAIEIASEKIESYNNELIISLLDKDFVETLKCII